MGGILFGDYLEVVKVEWVLFYGFVCYGWDG